MQTLSSNGVSYRTQLMELAAAERFAACIRGNERFQGAEVVESGRAKAGSPKRWFVSYQPASETRAAALILDQQGSRIERAEAQAANYEFVLDPTGRFFWTLNLITGEVYETTEGTCSCPDHTYRCRPAGLQCKHILILNSPEANIRGWH